MIRYDVIIIGAGIVGLATALKLLEASPDLKVCILEKEKEIAQHQTGHNSGVIHSGIYYKPGSLKAENCKLGYELLIDFATKHNIPFELCGKVIVATEDHQLPGLENIYKRGVGNELAGIKKLTKEEVKEHEPHVSSVGGIFVPQTGIIDYKAVSKKYLELIISEGGELKTEEKVSSIQLNKGDVLVTTNNFALTTKQLINCSGLYADKIAQMTGQAHDLAIIPFRGEYYMIKPEKQYLVKNLVYPVPNPAFPFLGVHFTRMIGGGLEAGPNAVLAFKREGYKKSDFDFSDVWDILKFPGFYKIIAKYWKEGMDEMHRSLSKRAFTESLQQLVPEITEQDLIPGGAGVRAQACDRKGNLLDDFKILEGPGVINVCNAPSPAATSSLSIGKTIADIVIKNRG